MVEIKTALAKKNAEIILTVMMCGKFTCFSCLLSFHADCHAMPCPARWLKQIWACKAENHELKQHDAIKLAKKFLPTLTQEEARTVVKVDTKKKHNDDMCLIIL